MQEQLALVIQERTGLDEDMARQVATVAIDFLKTQLPPPLAPLLDGQAPDLGSLGGLGNLGGLGGLFGPRGS